MNVLESTGSIDRLRIYLNDHRSLLAAEGALAERSRRANEGELARLLGRIVEQNAVDQGVVDSLLVSFDGARNPLKRIGALLGERFGRLKMNGQLKGYSPLSRVIEIEALLASSATRKALWNTVSTIHHDVTALDAKMHAEAANDQHASLGEFHVKASREAFGQSG